ncbi:RNA methyltransferase [Pollutibacter soli]|uniref:TrmH family RNA methyltransferase n=1 Tax=Pollutibacter soli TaxID=3034157 RepID=UPI0030136CFC
MLVKSKIKYIQSLSHKKFRDEYGAFVIEGPKIVEEFIHQSPERVLEVYSLVNWLKEQKSLLKKLGENQVIEIDQSQLERISAMPAPNQVVAVIKKDKELFSPPATDKISIALDGIQDPGNLGTIIRTADWFGITDIYCSENSADVYNNKVVQSSMGSLLRVKVHYLDLVKLLGENKVPVFAATLDGKDIRETISGKTTGLIIIGNESKGVRKELLRLEVTQIRIPSFGNAESLNAAVATAIILSKIKL